jgi:hypothetical protein
MIKFVSTKNGWNVAVCNSRGREKPPSIGNGRVINNRFAADNNRIERRTLQRVTDVLIKSIEFCPKNDHSRDHKSKPEH